MSNLTEKKHITKAEINELPMQQYEGTIHLCKTAEEAHTAAKKLLKEEHGRLRPQHDPGSFLGRRVIHEDRKVHLAPEAFLEQAQKSSFGAAEI